MRLLVVLTLIASAMATFAWAQKAVWSLPPDLLAKVKAVKPISQDVYTFETTARAEPYSGNLPPCGASNVFEISQETPDRDEKVRLVELAFSSGAYVEIRGHCVGSRIVVTQIKLTR